PSLVSLRGCGRSTGRGVSRRGRRRSIGLQDREDSLNLGAQVAVACRKRCLCVLGRGGRRLADPDDCVGKGGQRIDVLVGLIESHDKTPFLKRKFSLLRRSKPPVTKAPQESLLAMLASIAEIR